MDFRTLTRSDLDSVELRRLLWLAVEADDLSLGRIIDKRLSRLSVTGAVLDDVVVGFVAYDSSALPLVIEYIATAEAQRGTGLGRRLIHELQRLNPGAPIVAQTDDDAIGFYRKVGFTDITTPRDPRWPQRQRYDCVLTPVR